MKTDPDSRITKKRIRERIRILDSNAINFYFGRDDIPNRVEISSRPIKGEGFRTTGGKTEKITLPAMIASEKTFAEF